MNIDIDISGMTELAGNFRVSSGEVMAKVRPSISKGALNIKKDLVADMSASTHFRQIADRGSFSYDIEESGGEISAEVGPETGGRVVGDLAHFAYFGGANGGGGTVQDPQVRLEEEAPKLEKALGDIIDGLLS